MIIAAAHAPAALEQATVLIQQGQIVAYPTETLYGLGVDVSNPNALSALFQAKGRVAGQCFPVLVSDLDMLESLITRLTPRVHALIELHWPGPLTLILPGRKTLSPFIRSPKGGVGVRISSDAVATQLLQSVKRPITATSANRTGKPAATSADAVEIDAVRLVLDGGVRAKTASTVVEMLGEKPVILRQGSVRLDLEGD